MIKLTKLYIFVEGNDDELFFKKVIAPLFYNLYTDIEILQYAQWKKQKVDLFIQSIVTLDFDYIFTADIDYYGAVNEKKREVKNKYNNVLYKNIVVVIKEIESWYLAGVNDKMEEEFRINHFPDTDEVTKEVFNTIYHNKFRSRIDFMFEVLKHYSISTAMDKNQSFNFFIKYYKLNEFVSS